MTKDAELRQDLFQEALVHWWKNESVFPGPEESWYRNCCSRFLKNLLRVGRSVDSLKRRHNGLSIDEQQDELNTLAEALAQASFLQAMMMAEEQTQLALRLKPAARLILNELLEGYEAREIAQRHHISRRAVNKQRESIRRMAGTGNEFVE